MLKQRNQFDNYRTNATAATPTCCCCCCCLSTTTTTSLLLAQRTYKKGKLQHKRGVLFATIIAALVWPISIGGAFLIYNPLREATTTITYSNGSRSESSASFALTVSILWFLFSATAILYLTQRRRGEKNSKRRVFLATILTAISIIVEFVLTLLMTGFYIDSGTYGLIRYIVISIFFGVLAFILIHNFKTWRRNQSAKPATP